MFPTTALWSPKRQPAFTVRCVSDQDCWWFQTLTVECPTAFGPSKLMLWGAEMTCLMASCLHYRLIRKINNCYCIKPLSSVVCYAVVDDWNSIKCIRAILYKIWETYIYHLEMHSAMWWLTGLGATYTTRSEKLVNCHWFQGSTTLEPITVQYLQPFFMLVHRSFPRCFLPAVTKWMF